MTKEEVIEQLTELGFKSSTELHRCMSYPSLGYIECTYGIFFGLITGFASLGAFMFNDGKFSVSVKLNGIYEPTDIYDIPALIALYK